ncbi:hydrolase [Exophiala viscosa]|uniref:Hydrolase n=1 Tax=Exophiala viscosa TaxID=2486360 RepID=A0AAN6DWJ4_9EURO|nr:hydrolase [Exophiala viscosa]
MSTNGTAHAYTDLPKAMSKAVSGLSKALNSDKQWQAFVDTNAIVEPVTMGVQSTGSDEAILVTVDAGAKSSATSGPASKADFVLRAQPEQWEKFFDADPVAPYTSFVGLQGMNIKQEGVGVHGNNTKFAQYGHLATRLLELLRQGQNGPTKEDTNPETDEDHIIGRYIYVDTPVWGRTKIFYEKSGDGPQQVVFLHTAGSDSRQYHGVMNDKRTREKCTMIAFDLPAHGRSFPGSNHIPGNHTNNEDAYVGTIREVIKALKLNKPIVCGASMAGQVCVAVAIRADEVGAGGTIPLQGCDYLTMDRQFNDKSPVVNQSLFNPDWIYGMMAPKSPYVNKQLIWHMYSGQAYGIFHGDLDFYFGGFDARDRVASIDVKKCPIYFLTGEYDWSTTPAMSKATADKIKGANFKAMKGLGHFPATEDPQKFIPYFLDAVEWIQKTRSS